jgi:hypothetical protein
MSNLISKLKQYAESKTIKFHALLAFISFIIYTLIIILGFAPTTQEIDQSGYSTSDLQSAKTRVEVDIILSALEPFMDAVIRLSFLDYIFIIAGFLLFLSLNSILVIKFKENQKIQRIPLAGICLTILSRLLDSLENLWTILIYSNPTDYPTALITLVNLSGSFKWIVVGIEYCTLAIGWGFYFYLKRSHRSLKTIDEEEN